MKNHLMIDLETMGFSPGCAIVAIGAVLFNEDNPHVSSFYTSINLDSCLEYGLFTEIQTVEWWNKQKDVIKQYWSESDIPIPAALSKFSEFVKISNPCCIWGFGSDFDNVLLQSAYKAANIDIPWRYIQNRCYRTIYNCFNGNDVRVENPNLHYALSDAEFQAKTLFAINENLRKLDLNFL